MSSRRHTHETQPWSVPEGDSEISPRTQSIHFPNQLWSANWAIFEVLNEEYPGLDRLPWRIIAQFPKLRESHDPPRVGMQFNDVKLW